MPKLCSKMESAALLHAAVRSSGARLDCMQFPGSTGCARSGMQAHPSRASGCAYPEPRPISIELHDDVPS